MRIFLNERNSKMIKKIHTTLSILLFSVNVYASQNDRSFANISLGTLEGEEGSFLTNLQSQNISLDFKHFSLTNFNMPSMENNNTSSNSPNKNSNIDSLTFSGCGGSFQGENFSANGNNSTQSIRFLNNNPFSNQIFVKPEINSSFSNRMKERLPFVDENKKWTQSIDFGSFSGLNFNPQPINNNEVFLHYDVKQEDLASVWSSIKNTENFVNKKYFIICDLHGVINENIMPINEEKKYQTAKPKGNAIEVVKEIIESKNINFVLSSAWNKADHIIDDLKTLELFEILGCQKEPTIKKFNLNKNESFGKFVEFMYLSEAVNSAKYQFSEDTFYRKKAFTLLLPCVDWNNKMENSFLDPTIVSSNLKEKGITDIVFIDDSDKNIFQFRKDVQELYELGYIDSPLEIHPYHINK